MLRANLEAVPRLTCLQMTKCSDNANAGIQVRSSIDQTPAERLRGRSDAAKTSKSEHHQAGDNSGFVL